MSITLPFQSRPYSRPLTADDTEYVCQYISTCHMLCLVSPLESIDKGDLDDTEINFSVWNVCSLQKLCNYKGCFTHFWSDFVDLN